jgi:hypothetical protein
MRNAHSLEDENKDARPPMILRSMLFVPGDSERKLV